MPRDPEKARLNRNKHAAKKSEILGMSFGKAAAKLRKSLLFCLAKRLEINFCHRCGAQIVEKDFTIDHKDPWMAAEDPVAAFFDIDGIAFSHHRCNVAVARKGPIKYFTEEALREAKKRWRRGSDATYNAKRKAKRISEKTRV